MKKLAILGASYLQEPLIQKAKDRGIETHVFAWAADDIGEKSADYFYPISIVEKEKILEKCIELHIDGICSIASDIAVVTISYVAEKMGLTGNSIHSAELSTNKYNMRMAFKENGDPSPNSILVGSIEDLDDTKLDFPIIVKPIDRSGSRGVVKLENNINLSKAIERAKENGFQKYALVEEYITGTEYSVECISWEGKHTFLALTQKYTTGFPYFVETGHFEPAHVSSDILRDIQNIVFHALDSLEIKYGASHSEIKVASDGSINIIEIGARMGGDFIGSSLVELSTGVDFLSAVIDIALGNEPIIKKSKSKNAAVRFILVDEDLQCLRKIEKDDPAILVSKNVHEIACEKVTNSNERSGYFVLASADESILRDYLPKQTYVDQTDG